MPSSGLGQLITFAIESDEDRRFESWRWVEVHHGDTVARIAARYGHPEDARAIADANGIRSIQSVLHAGRSGQSWGGLSAGVEWAQAHGLMKGSIRRIKVPGELTSDASFSVLAGDRAPRIVGGYAKLSTVDRPDRVGLTKFDGYDPITMEVPIRFEAPPGSREGVDIEDDIQLLEWMAGRGVGEGAGVGPPPVIRLSTTDASGRVVPLIPANYQFSKQNPSAPLWRIQNPIDWDDEPLRNGGGNRIRQLATVTLYQHTVVKLATRSAAARHKAKKKPKKSKARGKT
jgi:hypothetical protein